MSAVIEAMDRVISPGLSKQELTLTYNEWAKDEKYDKDLAGIYNGPEATADALAELFPDETSRSGIYILDVGAGSGLVAEKLIEKSFNKIDALEPCDGLLNIAIGKRIYNHTFQTYVTDIPTEIDAGGVIVLTVGEYALNNVAEYKDRLEPMMKEHEKSGKWVSICRKYIQKYLQEYNAFVFVFKVL